jgi:ATP-dependent RNA helicase RhlE
MIKPASTVSHCLYPVPKHLKTPLLARLLREIPTESVLVFTRTKRSAEKVADHLAREGFRVASLQGNLSQSQRERSMDSFRAGSAKVMVATDIAARGLDVLSISHVVNYDMPDCADSYTHRIGRTGRVEQKGEALTFITPEDSQMVRDLEKLLGKTVERRVLEGFDYKKPAPTLRGSRVRQAEVKSAQDRGANRPRRRFQRRPDNNAK